MEPRTGESMKTFSKASGTNQKSVSSKESKDSRSLASEEENREACNGGNPVGCFWLGVSEYGRDNLDEAAVAFRKACDGGYSLGCYRFGLLEEKEGNLDEAEINYRKACDGGNPYGCNSLGVLEYHRGNIEQGLAILERSCNGGEGLFVCMKLMGLEQERGNYREVESLYRRVCAERDFFEGDIDRSKCMSFVFHPNGFNRSYVDEPPRVNYKSCSRIKPGTGLGTRTRTALNRRRYKKCIHVKNMVEIQDEVRKIPVRKK